MTGLATTKAKDVHGPITYMCPVCGKELEPGQVCPDCHKRARGYDLLREDTLRTESEARRKAKYGDKWRLFK